MTDQDAYSAVMDDATEFLGEETFDGQTQEVHRSNGRRFKVPVDADNELGSYFPGIVTWID